MFRLASGLVLTAFCFSLATGQTFADEVTDPVDIREAQQVLYERGLGDAVNFPDGKIGRNTRRAIREAQKALDMRVTGRLDNNLLNKLLDMGMPTDWSWGAVSTSTSSKYTYSSWNARSREEAVRKVLGRCKKSTRRAKCIVISSFANSNKVLWAAAIKCSKRRSTYVGTARARTAKNVKKDLYGMARRNGYRRKRCKIYSLIAANGSHKK